MIMKRTICIILAFSMLFCFAACGKSKNETGTNAADEGGKTAVTETATQKTITPTVKKSVEEDDDLGLMNVKIQETEGLSDVEKLLVNFFDVDYFDGPSFEALERYPKIYRGAQIIESGVVFKTIESNDETYTLLMTTDEDFRFGEPAEYYVIKGEQGDARIIEGDKVVVYGKFTGIDKYTVDGTSYNVPTILVNKHTFYEGTEGVPLYTFEEIRSIAKYIFGDDITIHDACDESEEKYSMLDSGEEYIVEIENQSNANFTKYEFAAWRGGEIGDAKSTSTERRFITVSADFKHFYLQIYNTNLKTYTLSCYDLNLKKLWSKDFDETNSATLDYTANHIYLVANGYMYIIDAETGEESVPKKYVGETDGIRKLKDGILLLRKGPSDAIMKTDLAGNVLWSVNTDTEVIYSMTDDDDPKIIVQIVEGNYVVEYKAIRQQSTFNPYQNKNETYNAPAETVGLVISPSGEVIYKGATQ